MKEKQLIIRIPEALHKKFKLEVTEDGLNMQRVVIQLIKLYLGGKIK